jgi:type IV secretory pathway TraG/TraD family ATPase VirD4
MGIIILFIIYAIASEYSRDIADILMTIAIVAPIIWSMNQIRIAGRYAFARENIVQTIIHIVGIAPAGFAIYYFQTHHEVKGTIAAAIYLFFAQNIWSAMIAGLNFSDSGDNEDVVRRGSRVIDARAGNGKRGLDDTVITIGGVIIQRMLEAQHFLITGTTGAGKTQIINGLLRVVRRRGNRAVIADPAGGFLARFGLADDLIFNPFDRRSVDWSPFAEIRADYDCERIAKAIIPDIEGGESAQWQLFAQTLLAKAMLAMHRNGERSIKRLMYWMTSADQRELQPLLSGTVAAVMCQKGNDKMLNNMRATMLPYLGIFDYLPDEGNFSIRQWVQEEWRSNWLFITYRDDQMGMLKNIVATALELALVEGLSMSENQDRGLWYVMDEVDSLGKVTSLRAGLTKIRKYGGRCVLGLQTIAQLRKTYGRDEAQTLLACASVKCILRAGDAETAKSMEQELGEQEIGRSNLNDSFNVGENGQSRSQSSSTQVLRQSAVLSSEIMNLPDLNGYLKLPGDEISQIQIDYVAMPEKMPAFE